MTLGCDAAESGKHLRGTKLFHVMAAALGMATLAGCASEDAASSFFVAPGQYVLFQCDDIDRAAKGALARQKELEQWKAKASTSTAGELIGDATYGTELATIRGQLRNLRQAARDKNCNFVPGEEPAPVPPPPPPPAKKKR
jgi:hypothetical protein